jgi:hypothetical protein
MAAGFPAEYFENRAREEEELLSSHPEWAPIGLRDRLLARGSRSEMAGRRVLR